MPPSVVRRKPHNPSLNVPPSTHTLMSICLEHDLSKLASITAFPCGDLVFSAPVYVLAPVQNGSPIPAATEGKPSPSGTKIKFIHDTTKCTDRTSVATSGYTHAVSLEWETYGLTEADYSLFVTLQNTPHEFLLTFLGGLQKVIRTDATSYQFIFNEDNGTMKCAATLINGQGLTLIKR